jgi:imidazolonepropionase-like amidohydrolase
MMVLLVATALPAAVAADLAIIHARVLPVDAAPIEDGTVLVTGGRIEAVGRALPVPPGTPLVVDATGLWLTPGFIDVHSHMGVYPCSRAAPTWSAAKAPC